MKPEGTWWGEYALESGQTAHWQIGPLDLWITSDRGEWQVSSKVSDEVDKEGWSFCCPAETPSPPDSALRLIPGRQVDRIVLDLGLADRPVVARPNQPLRVLPGQEVELFLSTPLWVRLKHPGLASAMVELPTWRPSDTWFGPNTRQGELCYAMRTKARSRLEDMPIRAYRALSLIKLRNHGQDPLPLERLQLPMADFSLFVDAEGRLWTETVIVERRINGFESEGRLDGPPRELVDIVGRVARSRNEEQGSPLIRVLKILMG